MPVRPDNAAFPDDVGLSSVPTQVAEPAGPVPVRPSGVCALRFKSWQPSNSAPSLVRCFGSRHGGRVPRRIVDRFLSQRIVSHLPVWRYQRRVRHHSFGLGLGAAEWGPFVLATGGRGRMPQPHGRITLWPETTEHRAQSLLEIPTLRWSADVRLRQLAVFPQSAMPLASRIRASWVRERIPSLR